jgi:hypothetical protein
MRDPMDRHSSRRRVLAWSVATVPCVLGSEARSSDASSIPKRIYLQPLGDGISDRATFRLGKVAVHEIGHTLGLEHCPNAGCIMEDAKGKVATSDGEYDLCDDCRQRLAGAGQAARETRAIPWPRS